MKRIILFMTLLVVGVLAASGWYGYRQILTEHEIDAFYATKDDSWGMDNGYVALIGIHAPEGEKDTYRWAFNLIKTHWQRELEYQARRRAGDASATPMPPLIDHWRSIQGKITPTADTGLLECYLREQWEMTGYPQEECVGQETLQNDLARNEVLIKRYRALFERKRFMDIPQQAMLIGQEMIREQQLFLTWLLEMKTLQPDTALDEWKRNVEFLQRAMADENNFIMRSLLMVMYFDTQLALPSLVQESDVAARNLKKLQEVLVPFGPKQMNLSAATRADYKILGTVIEKLGKHNRETFYRFSREQAGLADVPALRFERAEQEFIAKYRKPPFAGNLNNASPEEITDALISGSIITNLISGMHAQDARNRMLNLYVQIKANNIAPEKVEAFLKQSPAELYDPYTANPFRYDAEAKVIYYIRPGNPPARHGIRL